MERPRRRLVIASLSIGAAAAFTVPTLVSAGAAESAVDEAATFEPVRSSTTERSAMTSTTSSTTSSTAAPATPAPAPVEAPQVTPAPPVLAEPAPTTSAPAPAAVAVEPASPAPATEEVPVVEEPAGTGTLTVEVAAASGATRYVSLRTATGDLVAGPVTVDGEPITFADLAPGAHDLFVEHFADGGGTFLTRTPMTIVAGSDLLATCDAETLDCTLG